MEVNGASLGQGTSLLSHSGAQFCKIKNYDSDVSKLKSERGGFSGRKVANRICICLSICLRISMFICISCIFYFTDVSKLKSGGGRFSGRGR